MSWPFFFWVVGVYFVTSYVVAYAYTYKRPPAKEAPTFTAPAYFATALQSPPNHHQRALLPH